jgi:hypothetical protein
MKDYFVIFIGALFVIQLLLPLIFAVWPSSIEKSRRNGDPKVVIARKELRGWIYAMVWVLGIFTIITGYIVNDAIERLDTGDADAIGFVLFALFCVGIFGFMIRMSVTMLRAKIRDVKKAKTLPAPERPDAS